jgi:hypothetical protein
MSACMSEYSNSRTELENIITKDSKKTKETVYEKYKNIVK